MGLEGLSVKCDSRGDRRELAVANYKSRNDQCTHLSVRLSAFHIMSMKIVLTRKISVLVTC